MAIKMRGGRVIHREGFEVFLFPIDLVVDFDLVDILREIESDWNRQPLPSFRCSDTIPILPFVLLILHVVKDDEDISTVNLIKVAEPGNVLRLVYGE